MNFNFTILLYIFLRSFSLFCFLPINYRNGGILQKGLLAIILTFIGYFYCPFDIVNFSLKSIFLEIIFGSILSIPYLLGIEATLFVADFFDTSRGQQLTGVIDPISLGTVSSFGLLIKNLFIIILILIGVATSGVELYLKVLSLIPVGKLDFNLIISIFPQILTDINIYLSSIVWFLLIFSLLFTTIDWGFSIVAKLFPSFHLTQESFIAKSIILFLVSIKLVNDDEFASTLLFLVKPFSFVREIL